MGLFGKKSESRATEYAMHKHSPDVTGRCTVCGRKVVRTKPPRSPEEREYRESAGG